MTLTAALVIGASAPLVITLIGMAAIGRSRIHRLRTGRRR